MIRLIYKLDTEINNSKRTIITIYYNKRCECCALFSKYLIVQMECLSHLTWALITQTVTTTSIVWGATVKLGTNYFFLFHNFTDRRLILTTDLSNQAYSFVLFFLSLLRHRLFSLKGSSLQLLLAYPNFRIVSHHQACTLGPLLSKRRVTWTQALQQCW